MQMCMCLSLQLSKTSGLEVQFTVAEIQVAMETERARRSPMEDRQSPADGLGLSPEEPWFCGGEEEEELGKETEQAHRKTEIQQRMGFFDPGEHLE